MPVAHHAGRAVPIDVDGFLTDSSQWTPDIAEAIAAEAGIALLTSEHWTVLAFAAAPAFASNGYFAHGSSGGGFRVGYMGEWSKVTGPNPLEVPGLQSIELKMDQWDFELGWSFGIKK